MNTVLILLISGICDFRVKSFNTVKAKFLPIYNLNPDPRLFF